jgi:HSP20 family protein
MSKEIVRWPGFDFPRLRKEMEQLFEGFPLEFPITPSGDWVPAMDVSETKDGFAVKVEIPGMDAKDLNVQVTGDLLSIQGERRQEKEEKKEDYLRTERSFGSFYRSIRLPSAIDEKAVEAKYTSGVLTIKLPKTTEAREKQIQIQVE